MHPKTASCKKHGLLMLAAKRSTKLDQILPDVVRSWAELNRMWGGLGGVLRRASPWRRHCRSRSRRRGFRHPKAPGKVARHASREEFPPAIPAGSEVVRKLPNKCPKIVHHLLREPRFGPKLGRWGPMFANCCQHLAEVGQTWPCVASASRCWLKVDHDGPNSLDGSGRLATCGQPRPTLGQYRAMLGEFGPTIGSS